VSNRSDPLLSRPFFSVIIPNWNGAVHLPTCLESLRRQTFADAEVIVVDNGSCDESLALLAAYPEVRTVALSANRGFAGGVNAGIREARGAVIALLNNDTEADPRWLEEMHAALERHPHAGMIACKILLFDRRDHLHSAGDFYRLDGIPGNRGVWQPDGDEFALEEPVFSPCGAAAAYRREMLDDVGLFDESLFAFCEDADLGWRGQTAGWVCIYAPQSRIYHRVSATGGGVLSSFYNGRNCLTVIVKNYPGALLWRYRRRIVAAQLRITGDALRAWRGAAARARLRGQLAGLVRLPFLLAQRRQIQARRRVSVEYLDSILAQID
jgi:GT2 family glycosyltransferase